MYLGVCAELMRELATALTPQMGVESVDQLYDAFLAMACSVMRSPLGFPVGTRRGSFFTGEA
jgi:hypothetical protein